MKRHYISELVKKMFFMAFVTAVFTEFTQIIALTIDSIVICSFLGESEIGAVGLSSPFFFLVGVPANCLGVGLLNVCTREMGRGKIKALNHRFSETVLFTLLVMVLANVLVFLTIPQIAFLFGARGNASSLLGLAQSYLYGLSFEVVPFVLLSVLTPIVILDNGSSTSMLASVAGGVANIVFDLIVIRNGWGLFGIGFGSSLSVVVSLLVIMSHFFKKAQVIRFVPTKIVWEDIVEVLRIGLPSSLHALAGMFRSLLLNFLAISLSGGIGVAVLSIHNTLMDFVDIVPVGIAGALGIVSGISYGERNEEEIKMSGILAHSYIFYSSIVICLVLLAFVKPIGLIFLESQSAGFTLLGFDMRCIATTVPLSALAYAWVSFLQATGKEKDARRLEILSNLVFTLFFAVVLSKPFKIHGLFLAFPLAKACSLAYVYANRVMSSGRIIPNVEDYLRLDSRFRLEEKDLISYPITSLEESSLASEQIYLFCKGHKLSIKTAYIASLCLQEVADNIILHNTGKGNVAEIRLVMEDEHLIIRIRDNGESFNMAELAKIISDTSDPVKKIGIRIIAGLIKDISYYRIYGMNTTILHIPTA